MEIREELVMARLLDKAMTSDKKQVKDMLEELLMVTALTEDTNTDGPFSTLLKRTESIEKEMQALRRELRDIARDRDRRYGGGYGGGYTTSGYSDPYWKDSSMTEGEMDRTLAELKKSMFSGETLKKMQDQIKQDMKK